MVPLPLTNVSRLSSALHNLEQKVKVDHIHSEKLMGTPNGGMSFYQGSFTVPNNDSHPQDTFLRLDGWRKVSCLSPIVVLESFILPYIL